MEEMEEEYEEGVGYRTTYHIPGRIWISYRQVERTQWSLLGHRVRFDVNDES